MRHSDPGKFQTFDPARLEKRLARMDNRRIKAAFIGAVLLHASGALGFAVWTPPDPISPPGETVITVDLAPAMASAATNNVSPGMASAATQPQEKPPEPTPEDKIVDQEPPPPEPPIEPSEKEVVEQEPIPASETVQENVPPPPPTEAAEVVLAPKSAKPKPQPKPQPKTPSAPQAATSAAKQLADVGGSGAMASLNEINKYAGRVRAAIEKKKFKPASANGIGGVAFVSFTISQSGAVTGLRLTKSSGNAALDSAARASVTGADLPPIPEGLPTAIPMGVPIRFAP
jgi:protein TonB